MNSKLVRLDSVAGVPIHWLRWERTGRRFIHRDFLKQLDLSLTALWDAWPFGTPTGILSFGAYVPKPRLHGQGRAFDLAGFEFESGGVRGTWEINSEWIDKPKEAVAVECILRTYLPQVLGPSYDTRHRAHWHVDDRHSAVGFSQRSKADVRFVQWALNSVWRYGNQELLKVDGLYGPKTAKAVKQSLEMIGASGSLTEDSIYYSWLNLTSKAGFGVKLDCL